MSLRLEIVSVGKLRDRTVASLCDEYEKRARSFVPFGRAEAKDEAAAIAWARKTGGPVVLLDERGAQVTSTELAAWLRDWQEQGRRVVSFLIGGADGFDDGHRRAADQLLGLSRLTLPHRLALLLLCEQLYRAGTLLAGHPYHHA